MGKTKKMVQRISFVLFFLGALWLEQGGALADVVPAEPKRCTTGSSGTSSHAGSYCRPDNCTTNDECKEGKVCVEWPLCIHKVQTTEGGKHPANMKPRKITLLKVASRCANQTQCSSPHVCDTGKRCVSQVSAQCGCSQGDPTPVAFTFLLLLGLLLVKRRKRTQHSS